LYQISVVALEHAAAGHRINLESNSAVPYSTHYARHRSRRTTDRRRQFSHLFCSTV